VAVMALERVPSDIRAQGGVARMMIRRWWRPSNTPSPSGDGQSPYRSFRRSPGSRVSGVDYIDESEVLTRPTKRTTSTSGPSGAVRLWGHQSGRSAAPHLRGACLIRSKGEAGNRKRGGGRPPPALHPGMSGPDAADSAEQYAWAKNLSAPIELVREVARPDACRCRCSVPVVSPRRPTPPSSCNSEPRPCSWDRASSRARIRPAWPGPSWRPPPITTIRRS